MVETKIIVIGYDEIVILLNLLGIEGYVAKEKEEFFQFFNNAIKDPSIGIILVAMDLPKEVFDFLIEYKLNNKRPFVFILPDIFKPNLLSYDPILEKIKDSLGDII